jgi:hypothetical protein
MQDSATHNDPLLVERFVVNPHDMYKVELGKYHENKPEPQFDIRYGRHEPHVVTHDTSKLGDGKVYILFMTFQNFGNKSCEITVLRREPDLQIKA